MYKKLLSIWLQAATHRYTYSIGELYMYQFKNAAESNEVTYYTGKTRIVATTLSQWSVN